MALPAHLEHVTITTGDARRSYRSEVADIVVERMQGMIDEALASADARISLPWPDVWLHAQAEGRSVLTAKVWTRGGCAVSFSVARDAQAGEGLWRGLGASGPQPPDPWLAVRLEPGIIHLDPLIVLALGDLERCVAWAWLARGDRAH